LLAVSGGRDSMVLMHACADIAPGRTSVVHIDHGLHPSSGAWAEQVTACAAALSLPCTTIRVDATAADGESPEAAARGARYAALVEQMADGACLLTAHHRLDLAETLLLQLLRGAGPAGLAGMPMDTGFGPGRHLRPLLGQPVTELTAYADHHQLSWIEDPSNADDGFGRNYLRQHVMPLLQVRWPGADTAIARSAALCAESAERDLHTGQSDLGESLDGQALPLERLRALPEARARNALRVWMTRRGVRPPGMNRLVNFLDSALTAGADRNPKISWGPHELARFRDSLHLIPRLSRPDPDARWAWDGSSELDLGGDMGRVRLDEGQGGLDPELLGQPLTLRLRQGGEKIRPVGRDHRRPVKSLLREAGCPPWLRDRVPLLYAGCELIAVGPWWQAAEHAVPERGFCMKWILRESLQPHDSFIDYCANQSAYRRRSD
jgi:tRNA(Ile)-lysidine synthase